MIRYHPSIELLTEYSSGSLSLAKAVAVSAHLEHCKECRTQAHKLELVGAELFSDPAIPTSDQQLNQLKTNLLSKITNGEIESSFDKYGQAAPSVRMSKLQSGRPLSSESKYQIPKSLRQLIPSFYDDLKWMSLSPAVKIATLSNEKDGTQVALTRIKAGAFIPSHTHTGDEFTLVLEGAFSDESGVYKKGDFISRDARHKHKPVVTKDAECICLTVTEAPIEFTGWFTRLLNPILRKHHPSTS
ncbi:ChrR family anti-sigma-E factor [Marinomonas balearica]|uniref:ChrR-like anti-ECFsigma factor n=1 Tax=Marinomonas balearica TaxID=491947 RepID=A0A4R6M3I8_9GAMM|nr:ChrR family anti-sigma-E factor [Marinomonas balearica]TDO95847.1 ChrR-like anti-ECFsigma factor [Marinomonas balearica]